ncbi:hypothetical protein [Marinobacter confluentis]|uniref:Uncharacterized protein n=1 Tax=Marinobacter confluentis TaxID=1697557 RepID=A0A4Z1C493_9GAMM|nr:hypothetical protein [Marinobacter confluentis]TGN41191.1 hypothetical protein E5Q11_01160 [Marinobacter confluentis]
MSLISKPFDDSGVEMVDDIARYGTSISKRIEQFRQRSTQRRDSANHCSGFAVMRVLCDTVCEIIDTAENEALRKECARAANTFFIESAFPDDCPDSGPLDNHQPSQALIQEVSSILADDKIVPADGSVQLQTLLLALVWAALSFAMESLPADQARSWVRQRIMDSARYN